MALPTTLSSFVLPKRPERLVFKSSGGNIYAIGLLSSALTTLVAHKATDPTSSFSEVDSGGRPVTGGQLVLSMDAEQVGDVLHIAYWDMGSILYYVQFNMASDTWGTEETVISSGADKDRGNVSIRARTSDFVIFYPGDVDNEMGAKARCDIAHGTSGSWTTGVQVDNGGAVNWIPGYAVKGSSDRIHCFFQDLTNGDGYQRTFKSDNTLETFPSAFDSTIHAADKINPFAPGISYDDAGTQRVRCPYADSDSTIAVAKLDSGDAPTVTTDTGVSGVAALLATAPNILTANLSVNGKILQLLYADASTQDLWRDINDDDGGWGTDTEEWDAVTINKITANVYDRSGAKLAFVVDNGGTYQYNEISLAAGAQTISPGAIVSVQNFGTHKMNQNVNASLIASAETIGNHTVEFAAQDVLPSLIPSAEDIGTHVINQNVNPPSVVSVEDIGTHSVNQNVLASPIASLESFGTHLINQNVLASLIASVETIGNHTIVGGQTVSPGLITTAENFGMHLINQNVLANLIASVEQIGSHVILLTQEIFPSLIASAESFGVHVISLNVNPNLIPSVESIGNHTVVSDQIVLPSLIASAETIGDHSIGTAILPSAIVSVQNFGTHQISLNVSIPLIASAESIGSHLVLLTQFVNPSLIASEESIGSHSIGTKVAPSLIASIESFGTALINQNILASLISSAEQIGSHILTMFVLPSSIASVENIGSHIITPGTAVVAPGSIASIESFGNHLMNQNVNANLISSIETIGSHSISLNVVAELIASIESVLGPTLIQNQIVSPSAIISVEVFGDHVMATAFQVVAPSLIPSVESFGRLFVLEYKEGLLYAKFTTEGLRDAILGSELLKSGELSAEDLKESILTSEQLKSSIFEDE